jgi:hypothetical protein
VTRAAAKVDVEIADSTYRPTNAAFENLDEVGYDALVVAMEPRSRNTAPVFPAEDQMARRRAVRLNHLDASQDAILVSGEDISATG